MRNISLYDYQETMLQRIETELAKPSRIRIMPPQGAKMQLGRSVMVQMPTGTGKTFVMAATVQQAKAEGEVWIIAHRRELVEQMEQTLDKFGMSYVEARELEKWPKARIRVMSIQWLARNIHNVKTFPALIIIDEAHHAMAPSYQELWTVFPEAQRIGFTATPCRMQRTRFTKFFDVLLQSWSIDEFIKAGRLSLYDYVVTNRFSDEQRTIDSFEKRGADGDYQLKEMDEKLNQASKIKRLYETVERYAHGKKGIVYAINIRHAKNIAEYYSAQGIRAVAIDSKTPSRQRAQVVAAFKESQIDCLVNVNLFDEGFDCPDVEYIQMARPTLSLAKYMQMIGRGLRVHPDKNLCVMIDNVGLYRMFGLPNARRNWQRMFDGESAGRGTLEIPQRTSNHTDNEMEIVAHHSRMMAMTEEEKRLFEEHTQPYESQGRWGLKSGDAIVLSAVYAKIEPFIGNYAAFSIADNRWGVLTRRGRVIISPQYMRVNVLPDETAVLSIGRFTEQTVNLAQAEQKEQDYREWCEINRPLLDFLNRICKKREKKQKK